MSTIANRNTDLSVGWPVCSCRPEYGNHHNHGGHVNERNIALKALKVAEVGLIEKLLTAIDEVETFIPLDTTQIKRTLENQIVAREHDIEKIEEAAQNRS